MRPDTRRVLIVSFYYPPYSSVGGTRVSKMTRYLADHGWQATVLTVTHDDRPMGIDLEIVPEAIHRAPQLIDVMGLPRLFLGRRSVEGRRFMPSGGWTSSGLWYLGLLYRNVVCFPDPQIGWLVPAAREGLRLARAVQPHIIVSSSMPNTSHLVAGWIARCTGLPWIAELRDLWTDNHNFQRVAPLRALERQLEAAVLRRATALVTVSEVWAESLRKRFGRPTYVVPNGYDPLDYPEVSPPDHGFSLVYTGMFYNGKQNPDPLIQAIGSLSRAELIRPETFQVRLCGHYLSPFLARAESAGVLPFVKVDPPVAHRDSLRLQCGATALLFLDWADGREKGWYSAKIYEYLGARRPILSVGPHDSVVAHLLARTRAGLVGETAEEVRTILERWLQQQASGTLRCDADPAQLTPYQRQTAAATMAEILNRYARV